MWPVASPRAMLLLAASPCAVPCVGAPSYAELPSAELLVVRAAEPSARLGWLSCLCLTVVAQKTR
jgi:hypothetical protein